MKLKIKEIIFKIEWTLIIVVITSIISEKFRNYMEMYYICFLFIIFHEMAHIVVGVILGNKIRNIKISVCGLSVGFSKYIKNEYGSIFINCLTEVIIHIAGPLANYILATAFKEVKFVYEINMVLCIINLLPIYPLDGYNIIASLKIFKNQKIKYVVLKTINLVAFALFFIIMAIVVVKYNNYNCFIFMLYLLVLNTTK